LDQPINVRNPESGIDLIKISGRASFVNQPPAIGIDDGSDIINADMGMLYGTLDP